MIAWLLTLTVVLDPGHGGSEGGARGAVPGSLEKQATLEYARAIAQKLEERGMNVVLTRTGDELVPIRERVRRANREKGDLFVSIHLNASPDRTQRGFETYVLARDASDREAREVALREGATAGDLSAILSDLRLEAMQMRSARLGAALQNALIALLGKPSSRGLKQAPLDVLKGHLSPAVLVEVGFIDHPEEGPSVLSPPVREKVSNAIAGAIVEYSKELR